MKKHTFAKLIVVLSVLVCTLALLAVTAFAAEGYAAVDLSKNRISAGEEVVVTVSIKVDGVTQMDVVPSYDKYNFTLVSGEWNAAILDAAQSSVSFDDESTAKASIVFDNERNLNGALFRFTLKAKREAAVGKSLLSADVALFNGATALPAISVTGSNVTVICDAGSHSWRPATCTEPKFCTVCFETEGEPLGHAWGNATCTEPRVCNACGYSDSTTLGHDWASPTCTDPKTCRVCGKTEGAALGHTYDMEIHTPEYLKSEASCSSKAVYYYACSTCGAKADGDENTYEYGETMVHTGGLATCTKLAICALCGEPYGTYYHKYDAEIVDEKYFVSAATCTSKELYSVSCSECGVAGTDTFKTGEMLPHTYVEKVDEEYLVSAATCTSKALYNVSCSECGAAGSDTFESGEVISHSYVEKADEEYLVSEAGCSSGAIYKVSCSECGAAGNDTFEVGEATSHSYVEKVSSAYLVSAGNCEKKAVYKVSCSKCGAAGTETFEYGTIKQHTYAGDWQSDANGHWQTCSCGHKSDVAAHSWNDGDVTKAATVDAEGEKTFTCIKCYRERTETIPKLLPEKSDNGVLYLVLGIAAAVALAIAVIVVFVIIKEKKKNSSSVSKEREDSADTAESAPVEEITDSAESAEESLPEDAQEEPAEEMTEDEPLVNVTVNEPVAEVDTEDTLADK